MLLPLELLREALEATCSPRSSLALPNANDELRHALINMVAEHFLSATGQHVGNQHQPPDRDDGGASAQHRLHGHHALGSRDEDLEGCVELLVAMHRPPHGESWSLFLQGEAYHPMAALFLQHLLPMAFTMPSSVTRRVGAGMQLRLADLCCTIVRSVGSATARKLLPGVASILAKFLAAWIPRRDAAMPSRSLAAAAHVLHALMESCAFFTEDAMASDREGPRGANDPDMQSVDRLGTLLDVVVHLDALPHLLCGGPSLLGTREKGILTTDLLPLAVALRDCCCTWLNWRSVAVALRQSDTSRDDPLAARIVASWLVLSDICSGALWWTDTTSAIEISFPQPDVVASLSLWVGRFGPSLLPLVVSDSCARRRTFDASSVALWKMMMLLTFVPTTSASSASSATSATTGGCRNPFDVLQLCSESELGFDAVWAFLKRLVTTLKRLSAAESVGSLNLDGSELRAVGGSHVVFAVEASTSSSGGPPGPGNEGGGEELPSQVSLHVDGAEDHGKRRARAPSGRDVLNSCCAAIGAVIRRHSPSDDSGSEYATWFIDAVSSVLDDWDAYESHPHWLFIVGRVWAFGSTTTMATVPPKRSPPLGKKLLRRMSSDDSLEILWELLTKEHLWQLTFDWQDLTLPQKNHRVRVVVSALDAWSFMVLRLTVLRNSVTSSSSSSSSSRAGVGDVCTAVAHRVMVVSLYSILEKMAHHDDDVRFASERALKSLSQLDRSSASDRREPVEAQELLAFFSKYGRYVSDEAVRAMLDPELHVSALQVIHGFTGFMIRLLRGASAPNSAKGAVDAAVDGETHWSSITETMCAFLTDTIHALTDAVTKLAASSHRTDTLSTSLLLDDAATPSALAIAALTLAPTGSHRSLRSSNAPDLSRAAAQRRTYMAGCLEVLERAAAIERCLQSLPQCTSLVFPSETDWDDTRDVTAANPHVGKVQALLGSAVHDLVARHCVFLNDVMAAKSCELLVSICAVYVGPDGHHVIRTRLNLVHRTYAVLFRALQGCSAAMAMSDSQRSDQLAKLKRLLEVWRETKGEEPGRHTPLKKGSTTGTTPRAAFERAGQWLLSVSLPVELPQVAQSAVKLFQMAPTFLTPRYTDEVVPLLELWYMRCVWLPRVPTEREQRAALTIVQCLSQMMVNAVSHNMPSPPPTETPSGGGDVAPAGDSCRAIFTTQHIHEMQRVLERRGTSRQPSADP